MMREVCATDIRSVEPMKMIATQITTGTQYLKKDFTQNSEVKTSDERGLLHCVNCNLQSEI